VATAERDDPSAESGLSQLLPAMDYAVFEAVGATFKQSSSSPAWFALLASFDPMDCMNKYLIGRLPFLESFLPDAYLFWQKKRDGRIQSDFWTQTDITGQSVHLIAYAVSLQQRSFLLVRSSRELYEERETWQKYAHETAMQLAHVERLQRDMEATAAALAVANQKLNELSAQDPLTGIYNRRHFEHAFDLELRRTFRAQEPVSILFMDVDHFKELNETFGHSIGDECLRRVGALLSNSFHRPGDIAARIGEEEFAIVLPRIDARTALQLARTVKRGIRNLRIPVPGSNDPLRMTVSIGVYTRPPKGNQTMRQMLEMVDTALDRAKLAGHDQIVVCPQLKIP
jgi:diguanylate cyclase (GGDEF)-like protein